MVSRAGRQRRAGEWRQGVREDGMHVVRLSAPINLTPWACVAGNEPTQEWAHTATSLQKHPVKPPHTLSLRSVVATSPGKAIQTGSHEL